MYPTHTFEVQEMQSLFLCVCTCVCVYVWVFVRTIMCVYLVWAHSILIYNPAQVQGQHCKHNHEHRFIQTHIPAILLLARPVTIVPGLSLS